MRSGMATGVEHHSTGYTMCPDVLQFSFAREVRPALQALDGEARAGVPTAAARQA